MEGNRLILELLLISNIFHKLEDKGERRLRLSLVIFPPASIKHVRRLQRLSSGTLSYEPVN